MFFETTRCEPWAKVRTVDSTDNSFPSRIPRITEPTGDGIVGLTVAGGGGDVPGWVKLVPYATSGDNDTMDMRVIGWNRIGAGQPFNPVKTLWFPTILGQYTVTMSAVTGVAGAQILNTERFADTIVVHATIAAQFTTTDVVSAAAASTGLHPIISAANDLIGMIFQPLAGCEKFEILFDSTAVGTTAMNCLYSFYDSD